MIFVLLPVIRSRKLTCENPVSRLSLKQTSLGETMRSHSLTLILGLYLFFALGCSSKPTGANGPADSGSTATDSSSKTTPPAAKAEPMTVPAGVQLTVRLGQAVGSKISQSGQSFSATLANAVQVGGTVAIPAGTKASGTVVDAEPLGHFAGGARLQLQLTSMNVNGADQPIQTASIVRVIKGKGKRTGIMAGGGAALGAIIGGIAGGGKGAAVGALAGGGAGTAGGAMTGNKEIVLPAEAALTFKLQQSLEIK
jgi:hypothetical protein